MRGADYESAVRRILQPIGKFEGLRRGRCGLSRLGGAAAAPNAPCVDDGAGGEGQSGADIAVDPGEAINGGVGRVEGAVSLLLGGPGEGRDPQYRLMGADDSLAELEWAERERERERESNLGS